MMEQPHYRRTQSVISPILYISTIGAISLENHAASRESLIKPESSKLQHITYSDFSRLWRVEKSLAGADQTAGKRPEILT